MRNVSVFSKSGKVTPEMKRLFSIAVTMDLALLAHPNEDPCQVLSLTARRMRSSGNYRKQWDLNIINKYRHADARVLAAHSDTIQSIQQLNANGYKTY